MAISSKVFGKLFAQSQNFIPQAKLSDFVGTLAKSEDKRIKTPLIKGFAKIYGIRLDEYARDFHQYDSFNDFFTRELKLNARPINADSDGIICPADGMISQIGRIDGEQILQAKGRTYSAGQLLASMEDEHYFKNGEFVTVYLAPSNYHRVHMPFDGVLVETRYIPGDLFSVNNTTAAHIPDLFARNERLVCVFETAFGRACVVLVGAMIVAGIECVATGKLERTDRMQIKQHNLPLKKADELGRFYLGSTAIVVLPEHSGQWLDGYVHGTTVQMGEKIGTLKSTQSTQ